MVTDVEVTLQGKVFKMDAHIIGACEGVKKLRSNNMHCICVIDGMPGTGKSTLAQQMAAYVDPYFCVEKLVFEPEKFYDVLLNVPDESSVIFDEAITGLDVRNSMTSMNKILNALLDQIRMKRLFIILCLPSIFDMDKRFAIKHATFLLQTRLDQRNMSKGRWAMWGYRSKKRLFRNETERRIYNYGYPPCDTGRFYSGYVLDEVVYNGLKRAVLDRYKPKFLSGDDVLVSKVRKKKVVDGDVEGEGEGVVS